MTTDTSSDAAGEPPPRSARSSRPPGPDRTSASSSTSSTESRAELEIGWVGKAHGLDGAFRVTRPENLREGLETSLGRITEVFGTPSKPVVRVEGIASIAQVEGLRGTPLVVAREAIGLEEGEWWADDLVGLAVVDGARAVGTVERVRALPSCEVLVVTSSGDPNLRGSKDESILIPLIDDAVRTVDVAAGVIDVDLEFLGGG